MLYVRKLTGVEKVLCDERLETSANSKSDIESEPVGSQIRCEIECVGLRKISMRFRNKVFRKWQWGLMLSLRS